MQTVLPTMVCRSVALLMGFFCFAELSAQRIPACHSNLKADSDGLYIDVQGEVYREIVAAPAVTLEAAQGAPRGTSDGLSFDFGIPALTGRLYYGFVPYGDSRHPHPVYFKRYAEVEGGKARIDIKNQLDGRYDMIGWEESGQGTIGYRLMDERGLLLYDGRVTFSGTGPFEVAPTIIEGPLLHQLSEEGAIISVGLNQKAKVELRIEGKEDPIVSKRALQHEIKVSGLEPATTYQYTVQVKDHEQQYRFTTAPLPGSRGAFTFAYASDSRSGQGGGERDIYGANAYIMKKIMALATQEQAAFFQFSGDLINGYLLSPEEIDLQYANWKRAVQPFWHYFPIYISMGNHEALMRAFKGPETTITIDRFPYDTESAEAVFARNFVGPRNGPRSEDGASYDPDPKRIDFPSYEENVFSYTYDNVGVIVLNSDYWYAPSTGAVPLSSGNIHGYIMDQQLAWLEERLQALEEDDNIDHVFITQHTPCFPNGGHVDDDMWYRGDNSKRPFVVGKPVSKGIIQRRDEMLDLLVNQSDKVIAVLTGDEHNYARTEISPEMPRYPEDYPASQRIELSRTIYQINNGAAGAPYYAQERTPWSDFVSGFTTQNALVLFDVEGQSITMRVLNPDTLEEVDRLKLR
jgi:3',5'-cyclic AMP phosphodiesterase CpdA